MLYSIDRFEGDVAVLIDEEGNRLDIPRTALPSQARSGDMLRHETEGFQLDTDAVAARRAEIAVLQKRLRHR